MITLVSIIVLGFFLGMRHATDPDHVIAVTTIVSRRRSVRQAALIGLLWGLGHTITILVVGSAIILFGLVIPPRIGLTMELSVGLMLILLGVLNLSGMLRWITETVRPLQLGQHSHPHGHGDYIHSHLHGHGPERHGHSGGATPVARAAQAQPLDLAQWMRRFCESPAIGVTCSAPSTAAGRPT